MLKALFRWSIAATLISVIPVAAGAQPVAAGAQNISKERFVNEIFRSFVDSSFNNYRLSSSAYPCSFVKFRYDEWVQYVLFEEVTIQALNELAGQAYTDHTPSPWQCDSLQHTVCIDETRTDSLLDPLWNLPLDPVNPSRHDRRLIRKRQREWQRLPPEQRTLFVFSRPVFTADGHYAMLDMDFHCDKHLCGLGSTCLFRQTGTGWKLVGRLVRWKG